MSQRTVKPGIKLDILKCLEDGEKTTAEIKKAVSGKGRTIDTCLSELKKEGKTVSRKKGVYALPVSPVEVEDSPAKAENSRGEAENTETINKMLNLYDKLLDTVAVSIETEDWDGITEKIEAIKSLRWLGATVDQLMKRWYLLYRGYDTNTRQAVEDAKQKTSDREKQAMEHLPPEEQLEVVGDYDVKMRELLEALPEPIQKKVTV